MILSASVCRFWSHKREQVADVADDAVDDVRDLAHDGHAETDWLPGLFADHFELHDRLADARAGGALAVAVVPDHVRQHDQPGDHHGHLAQCGCSGGTELTEVVFRRVGDARRLAGADQEKPSDAIHDEDRDGVDEPCQHARKPWRISLFRQCRARCGAAAGSRAHPAAEAAAGIRHPADGGYPPPCGPGGGGYPPGGGGGGG